MKKIASVLLVIMITSLAMCKSAEWTHLAGGELTILSSSNSPFPHPDRFAGHTYNDTKFSFEEHYKDSSVAIFIPDNFNPGKTVDLVFYFHGWGNNIQKSLEKFELLEQYSQSRVNAIFIFPEGPKDASDSFGGKLEEAGVFKALVSEVLAFLKEEKKIDTTVPGNIVLSGHSGAYRVIAYILNRGGLSENIREVYLFDALYGQVENYTHWLQKYDGRLINICTPDGGTRWNSMDLVEDLNDWGVANYRLDSDTVSLEDLRQAKVISIFTGLEHSGVINPFFQNFLETSDLQKTD